MKPSLENSEPYFASLWNQCNCVIVWTFFGLFFGIEKKTHLFQSCGHCWVRRDKLFIYEPKKGAFVYSQQKGSVHTIKYDYKNKDNKEQVKERVSNMESELAFSLQQTDSVDEMQNGSHINYGLYFVEFFPRCRSWQCWNLCTCHLERSNTWINGKWWAPGSSLWEQEVTDE